MTDLDFRARQAEYKRFRDTEVGGLLYLFVALHGTAWQTDQQENASHGRMKAAWAASDAAYQALVAAIKELQAKAQ